MQRGRPKPKWFILLLSAFLLLVAVVKYRGGGVPTIGLDAAMPYAGSRLWLAGSNPYDEKGLRQAFIDGRGDGPFRTDWTPPVYPPTALVLWSPLSLLSWHAALHVWNILAVILLVLAAGSLVHLAGLRWWEPRALLLLLFCAVFAPLRSGLELGQNAVPAICLSVLSVAAVQRGRDVLAGSLLAIAVCLKPHDALLIAVYFALIRRWKTLSWTLCGVAGVAVIAVVRPGLSHGGWVADWLQWVRLAGAPGAVNDPALATPFRFQMIHLVVALHSFVDSRALVTVLVWVICGVIGLCGALPVHRSLAKGRSPDLLVLSVVVLVGLLAFFHRFPDALLLMIPMAWAVSTLGTSRENQGRVTLVLLLPFIAQIPDLLIRFEAHGHANRMAYSSWWRQILIFPSLIWLMLFQLLWLVGAVQSIGKAAERND